MTLTTQQMKRLADSVRNGTLGPSPKRGALSDSPPPRKSPLGKTLTLISLVLAASPAHSQSSYDGWGALGRALAGGNKAHEDETYRQRYIEDIEAINAVEEAKRVHEQREIVELEFVLRSQLTNYWKKLGLSEAEATNIAAAYQLRPEQLALNDRAKRDGQKEMAQAAIQAYRAYQYLLADQLLIAATREGVSP